MVRTTIIVQSETRDALAEIGKKKQTYDHIIRGLIELQRKTGGSPDLEQAGERGRQPA